MKFDSDIFVDTLPAQFFERRDFLKCTRQSDTILEIGPFANPLFRRNEGYKVKYFDIMDSASLKKRAEKVKYNPKLCPSKIDYISESADLSIVNDKFNIVFSAHVIEHQPNLLKHLLLVENLLRDTGAYFLAIPDKRYCFDYYKPLTDISDILESYYLNSEFHTLRTIIQNFIYRTHNKCKQHWNEEHGFIDLSIDKLQIDYQVNLFNKTTGYIDYHALFFTPTSFFNIINFLYEKKYTQLKLLRIYNTLHNTNEFYCILGMKNFDMSRIPMKASNELCL